MVATPRPFRREGLLVRIAPFAGAAAAGLAVAGLPSAGTHQHAFVTAVALTVAVVLGALVAPWHRLPIVFDLVPALSYLAIIGLLREAEGGAASGYAPLVMLPIFWIALYGTAGQLIVVIAAAAATFVEPMLLIGEPRYPLGEWRATLLWVLTAAIIGLAVQRLVRDLRRRREDTAAVGQVMGQLAATADAGRVRTAICETASKVSGASFVVLWEPLPDTDALVASASVGADLEGALLPMTRGDVSGPVQAYLDKESFFVSAPRRRKGDDGARSLFYQSIVREGTPAGVLAVGWSRRRSRLGEHSTSQLALVADLAAVALERADLVTRLESLARTDALTGLPNRRTFEDEFRRQVVRARLGGHLISLAMIDLDHFKDYNDERGHQAGDRLLKEAAAAWRNTLRMTDTLARYGGEEFAVILEACGLEDAMNLAERLRDSTPGGQTCSIGVAEWDGIEPLDTLIARADVALYKAKRTGRDCAVASLAA